MTLDAARRQVKAARNNRGLLSYHNLQADLGFDHRIITN